MDTAEEDMLTHMSVLPQHCTKPHSTDALERLSGKIKRSTGVVGIFSNEDAITHPVGASLLEQNDVYGPPPPCKAFRQALTTLALAVVYPALSCGYSYRRPPWFPPIIGLTNERELMSSIVRRGQGDKGRKRHVVTDTLGNVLEGVVYGADVRDRDGAPV